MTEHLVKLPCVRFSRLLSGYRLSRTWKEKKQSRADEAITHTIVYIVV